MSDQPLGPGWWRASDGRWYPPGTHPANRPPPPPAGTPPVAGPPASAPPPAAPPRSTQGPSARRRVLWIALVVAVALAAGAVVAVSRDDTEEPAAPGADTEVLLEPLAAEGPDAFTTSTAVIELGDGFPTSVDTVAAAGTAEGPVTLVGTTPGLYGGSADRAVCDTDALVAFLTDPANAGKAGAWAAALDIEPSEIAAEVASLTPTVLLADTLVTNHGYDPSTGRATPRQSVLQAGTAVLVDDTGVPRVRCACGNPLAEPAATSGFSTTGDAWAGYRADGVVRVSPGDPSDSLTLTDVDTGARFDQPIGSAAAPAGDIRTVDIRTVDLQNRRWPVDLLCGEGFFGEGITEVDVVDGSVVPPPDAYPMTGGSLDAPVYADVTGDGVEEALVVAVCNSGTSSLDGTVLTVGLDPTGAVVPVVRWPGAPDVGDGWVRLGGVTVDGGDVSTTWTVWQRDDPTCCPTGQMTATYRVAPGSATYEIVGQSAVEPYTP